MKKSFLALLLIVPMLVYCGGNKEVTPDQQEEEQQKPDEQQQENPPVEDDEDLYAKAATELIDGQEVQATNPIAEKFVNEVSYPDKTYNQYTEVLNYYGGFNGKAYNENGEEDPNGLVLNWSNCESKWPDGDRPLKYSIRWTKADLEEGSDMTLTMKDNDDWSGTLPIKAGNCYVNISNLVPNREYTYTVTCDNSGKVLKQGKFSTKASSTLHQVAFSPGCRNGRDLGGWKTLDGKTVKYHKLYRGGRLQSETIGSAGKNEIRFEGIGGQLDLRGSDKLPKAAVNGLEFLAPGIEEGGTAMLKEDHEKTKQCFEFIVNCLRNNKPVYFHCSLGRDRTGTLDILLLGLLGVREGEISKAYEVTYFAPRGYSVSSSEKPNNPEPIFKNTRMAWAYADVVPYFWELADTKGDGSFASGVEYYLLNVAQVSQKDIDDYRSIMLTD
ncbi:MAG: tyrosine-protein phosphatase [Bacteroidales bacterium]|nr:tyrosine-protein phosphatase [Bacteroidales bacterium]